MLLKYWVELNFANKLSWFISYLKEAQRLYFCVFSEGAWESKVIWMYMNFIPVEKLPKPFFPLKYADSSAAVPTCLPEYLNLLHKLTCDDTGEGAAHSHWRERGGGPAKGRHDWRRPAKGCEGGGVTVVAVVVCLHSWRMTHQGGVRPIMAQMGVDRRSIRVIGSVLECRALVLFTPDATHCQACRKEKENLINNEYGCLYLEICV